MLSPKKISTEKPTAQGLDQTFAEDGVAYRFSAGSAPLQIVARRPNGKILLVGSITWEDRLDFQLVQLLENGQRDPDFGEDGIVKGGFKDGAQAFPYGAQLYEDGKTLLIGTHYGDKQYLAFARFLEDGSPDVTFGDGGVVIQLPQGHLHSLQLLTAPLLSTSRPASNTAIGPNGEIIMASWTQISRYDRNGEPDLSFNGSGYLKVTFRINAVGVSADGSITVVGTDFFETGIIARFKADGSPDEAFGTGGTTEIRVEGVATVFSGLLLRDDGSSFVSGSLDRSPNDVWGTGRRGVITAFNSNGQPNLVFNGGKPVVSKLSPDEANSWSDIGGDPSHGIVVVGLAGLRSKERTLVARYDITGKPDTRFGTDGFLKTFLGSDRELWTSVVVQPDHKIIASGDCRYLFDLATVARFLASNEQ